MHPILWAPHTSFSSQASIYNNFYMPFFFFTFQLYTFVYAISIFWTISSSSTWKTPIYPTVPCSTSPPLRNLFWWLGQSLAPPLRSLCGLQNILQLFSLWLLPPSSGYGFLKKKEIVLFDGVAASCPRAYQSAGLQRGAQGMCVERKRRWLDGYPLASLPTFSRYFLDGAKNPTWL